MTVEEVMVVVVLVLSLVEVVHWLELEIVDIGSRVVVVLVNCGSDGR